MLHKMGTFSPTECRFKQSLVIAFIPLRCSECFKRKLNGEKANYISFKKLKHVSSRDQTKKKDGTSLLFMLKEIIVFEATVCFCYCCESVVKDLKKLRGNKTSKLLYLESTPRRQCLCFWQILENCSRS